MNKSTKRATCADVARLANVSTAVVSYVINNGPRRVSPETAERVRRAAQMLDYRPNSAARALRLGKSRIIGVVVPDLTNPYFAALNDAIETAATEHGASTMFLTSHSDPDHERTCIDKLLSRDVDAILLTTVQSDTELATLQKHPCRYVVFDHSSPIPGCSCICSDFTYAVTTAVEHLFDHGHTRIAMLFGGDPGSADTRILAWRDAHRRHQLPEGRIVRSYYSRKGGYDAMNELLDLDEENRPTAVFAASDMEAVGALRAIHERGLNVPDDMALISFDGTIDCLYTWPQLTSLHQDPQAIASCALKTLFTPKQAEDVQIRPMTFDIRESCGHHS